MTDDVGTLHRVPRTSPATGRPAAGLRRLGTALAAGLTMAIGLSGCSSAREVTRIDIGFEAPGERIVQVTVEWPNGKVSGQSRTAVPGCDEPWNAACWNNRPLARQLDAAQRAALVETLAAVPMQARRTAAPPAVAHYALAVQRGDAVEYATVRTGDSAASRALARALQVAAGED